MNSQQKILLIQQPTKNIWHQPPRRPSQILTKGRLWNFQNSHQDDFPEEEIQNAAVGILVEIDEDHGDGGRTYPKRPPRRRPTRTVTKGQIENPNAMDL